MVFGNGSEETSRSPPDGCRAGLNAPVRHSECTGPWVAARFWKRLIPGTGAIGPAGHFAQTSHTGKSGEFAGFPGGSSRAEAIFASCPNSSRQNKDRRPARVPAASILAWSWERAWGGTNLLAEMPTGRPKPPNQPPGQKFSRGRRHPAGKKPTHPPCPGLHTPPSPSGASFRRETRLALSSKLPRNTGRQPTETQLDGEPFKIRAFKSKAFRYLAMLLG